METWELEKEFKFEAAHQLPKHKGKCSRLHGHSWVGRITIQGTILNPEGSQTGMLLDYSTLKEILTPIIDNYLDHYFLNTSLKLDNPTSEEVARWIYRKIYPDNFSKLEGCKIYCIQIDETCTSSCKYYPNGK